MDDGPSQSMSFSDYSAYSTSCLFFNSWRTMDGCFSTASGLSFRNECTPISLLSSFSLLLSFSSLSP